MVRSELGWAWRAPVTRPSSTCSLPWAPRRRRRLAWVLVRLALVLLELVLVLVLLSLVRRPSPPVQQPSSLAQRLSLAQQLSLVQQPSPVQQPSLLSQRLSLVRQPFVVLLSSQPLRSPTRLRRDALTSCA